jgi:hypothetical protein
LLLSGVEGEEKAPSAKAATAKMTERMRMSNTVAGSPASVTRRAPAKAK